MIGLCAAPLRQQGQLRSQTLLMTTPFNPEKLLARMAADAADEDLDDAAFRQRTLRAVKRLQRELVPHPTARSVRRSYAGAKPSAAYRYIAVPNGAGGSTSVSLSSAAFEELAQVLGGAAQVNELARKAALGHKLESGISRSAYVRKRLQQRAARAAR